jgi:acyl-CoA thioesterase FadM
MSQGQARPTTPDRPVEATGWSGERQLWWRDFDSLGHVTASSYCVIYHDVFGDFMEEKWGPGASYVVRRIAIDHVHEIIRSDGPVRVRVEVTHVGRSSLRASMVMSTGSGVVASTAEGVYVAWDGERRGSRPITDAERRALG